MEDLTVCLIKYQEKLHMDAPNIDKEVVDLVKEPLSVKYSNKSVAVVEPSLK